LPCRFQARPDPLVEVRPSNPDALFTQTDHWEFAPFEAAIPCDFGLIGEAVRWLIESKSVIKSSVFVKNNL
jgi:hypothetical protein